MRVNEGITFVLQQLNFRCYQSVIAASELNLILVRKLKFRFCVEVHVYDAYIVTMGLYEFMQTHIQTTFTSVALVCFVIKLPKMTSIQ